MNSYVVSHLINTLFVPSALTIGAMVTAVVLLLVLFVTMNDLLNFRKDASDDEN
jgi:hypothetical protein